MHDRFVSVLFNIAVRTKFIDSNPADMADDGAQCGWWLSGGCLSTYRADQRLAVGIPLIGSKLDSESAGSRHYRLPEPHAQPSPSTGAGCDF